ncbi:MAG: phosphatase PAP2 family protein [candidate division Zixibacteria bacterium]|nr:phosphatase PAP2 family protein [candidate division Zixibacteria bacterium]
MLEWLINLDTALFLFFNVTLSNPVTNFLMPIITSDNLLRVGYGSAMILILWKGDARLRWLVLFSILTLTATDQLASHFFKPLLERARPCQIMENINLLVNCGAGFAMPSSHAANAFGQAAIFGLLLKKVRVPLIIFASVIAISRVCVGVHFVGDILAGALLGLFAGLLLMLLFRLFERKYMKRAVSD